MRTASDPREQDSEHAAVVVALFTKHDKLVHRGLLDIAITRDKKLVARDSSTPAVILASTNADAKLGDTWPADS